MTPLANPSVETSAMAALAAIRNRNLSARELTAHFLARIEGDKTGALRHVLRDQSLAAADRIDALIAGGGDIPPLAGLPVVVKENCDTAGAPCSAGLDFRASHLPSVDAAIVSRLRAAGAIVLGVSISDPGAFSVRTPDVTNPWGAQLTVGGSSGGSAAALAAGLCLGAIGTDTGGSVRIPSACCGTSALKPGFGTLPMDGVFPLVPSLDHVGPMARSVEDVALLWRALSRPPQSPSSRVRRVGYDPRWVETADDEIRAVFAAARMRLQRMGVEAVEVDLPDLDQISKMHGQIFIVEAAAYHSAHHGQDLENYPHLARSWFADARSMQVGTYVDACIMRAAMTAMVDRILEGVDAILTPTLATSRPGRWAETVTVGGVERDFTMGLVRLTSLFNHTGHPTAVFAMAGAADPLAASLQLVGRRGAETGLLKLACALQADAVPTSLSP